MRFRLHLAAVLAQLYRLIQALVVVVIRGASMFDGLLFYARASGGRNWIGFRPTIPNGVVFTLHSTECYTGHIPTIFSCCLSDPHSDVLTLHLFESSPGQIPANWLSSEPVLSATDQNVCTHKSKNLIAPEFPLLLFFATDICVVLCHVARLH